MYTTQVSTPCLRLVVGRLADNVAEVAFVSGVFFLGAISIGAGFVNDDITFIVLRALMGIGMSGHPYMHGAFCSQSYSQRAQ